MLQNTVYDVIYSRLLLHLKIIHFKTDCHGNEIGELHIHNSAMLLK